MVSGFAVCGENPASVSRFVAEVRHDRPANRPPYRLCAPICRCGDPVAGSMGSICRFSHRTKRSRCSPNTARTAYEDYVSHATKVGKLYADLTKETFKSYQDFASKLTPVR
jgi:hypothetical protein